MGDRQYICISSCQHYFSALVCTIYLVYSCVLLCEADPGTVTLLCLCHRSPLPVAVFLPQAVNARDGGNCPEHSLCWWGQGPDTEHHRLWANPFCILTDPGLERLIITWWLMSYLAGNSVVSVSNSMVWQHLPHVPRAVTASWSSLTPTVMFQDGSLWFGFLSAAQANNFLGGSTSFYASSPWQNTVNTELLVCVSYLLQGHVHCTIPL